MRSFFNIIKQSKLFEGLEEQEVEEALICFQTWTRHYTKGSFVSHQAEEPKGIGLLLQGELHIIKEDFLGNKSILTEIEVGEIFGEVYAVLQEKNQTVAVVAEKDATVMFFSIEKVLNLCKKGCAFHSHVINNLLRAIAEKNLLLTGKMEHLSKKNTREKVVSYLSSQQLRNGKGEFDIPFNRQQLADYLSVERSALSRELSFMRQEGLIEFYKNHFILYNNK